MSPRAGLDRETVVRTAAAMADAAGGEVTLSSLAAELGVRTPSLYNHVAGQDGLRRDLTLLGLLELRDCIARAAIGKAADEALVSVAHVYRDFARRRPGVYPLTQQSLNQEDAELAAVTSEILDMLRAIMDSFQLEGDSPVHAIRGYRSLLHGFASLEVTGGFGIPVDIDQSFRYAVQTFIRGLRGLKDGRALPGG